MKVKVILLVSIIFLLVGCSKNSNLKVNKDNSSIENKEYAVINKEGLIIKDRFKPPNDYIRTEVDKNSFADYLRNLPLKPHGEKVKYYNGDIKSKANVYEAVIDMDIGNKDLQQCADAIMRLRAEYLYQNKEYDKIHFNYSNGFNVDYNKWMQGYRVDVNGNKTNYIKNKAPSNTYEDFINYMENIFMYAGTMSLSQELIQVDINDMKIGDVFIKGGNPGHAVIVVDMAINNKTGNKIYMLAQSYMPAQDIQILCNNYDKNISPWYELTDNKIINTPEWKFDTNQLMRFSD